MDRSMAQTLHGLIPSSTGPLPQELVELSVSLLAQSRSKGSLNAGEEIARSYACANIACERLKHTLALPKIESRPPCPPRVYRKLYTYLNSALPATSKSNARSSRQRHPSTSQSPSPVKAKTMQTSKNLSTDKKWPQKSRANMPEAPVWVMPTIRLLCKKMGTPIAPHHIFAGVSSILSAQEVDLKKQAVTQAITLKIPALVIAIYLIVRTRLIGLPTRPEEYNQQLDLALEISKEAAAEDEERANVARADIDKCMRDVRDQQWTQMDWFENIPVGIGVGLGADEGLRENQLSESEAEEQQQLLPLRSSVGRLEPLERDYLQAGLGTMMQDRVDYLSEDRRREFREWKKSILAQIEELEKGQETDTEPG